MMNYDIEYMYVTKYILDIEHNRVFRGVPRNKLNDILKIALIFKDYWENPQHLFFLLVESTFKGEDALYEILNHLNTLNIKLDEFFILKDIFRDYFVSQLTERHFFSIIKGFKDSSIISDIRDVDTVRYLLHDYIDFIQSIPFAENLITAVFNDARLLSIFRDLSISNIDKSLIAILSEYVEYTDISDLHALLNNCISENFQHESIMDYLSDKYNISIDSNINCHCIDFKYDCEYIYLKHINKLFILIEEVLYVFSL